MIPIPIAILIPVAGDSDSDSDSSVSQEKLIPIQASCDSDFNADSNKPGIDSVFDSGIPEKLVNSIFISIWG